MSLLLKVEPDTGMIQWLLSKVFRSRKRRIDSAVEEEAQLLEWRVAEEAPKKTGRLAGSIRAIPASGGYYIVEGMEYGKYVRLGTRARPIYPRYKKALWWPGLSHPVRMVNHPETKPNDYAKRALDRAEGSMDSVVASLGYDLENGTGS